MFGRSKRNCATAVYITTIDPGEDLHHTILRAHGRDVTEYLVKNLTDRGYSFTASAEREAARDISEKLLQCFESRHRAQSIDKENTCERPDGNIITVVELKSTADSDKEKTHELFNGNNINFGADRFRCVEVLFQSNFTGKKSLRNPRHFFPEKHEMGREHPQEFVRRCRVVKRHDHVPTDLGHDDGTDGVDSTIKAKVVAPRE